MKFFLTSVTLYPSLRRDFEALVGKAAKDTKIAIIDNASDLYPIGDRQWIADNSQIIIDGGYQVEFVDLNAYRGNMIGLRDKLASVDVVWLSSGNTYYLRWILQDTGADKVIKKLVQNGLIYGGASAGIIVAGPTLHYFQEADDPSEAPEEILEGMKLVDQVVLPHWNNEHYGAIIQKADGYLKADGYVTVPIKDNQALVLFDEEAPEIVP